VWPKLSQGADYQYVAKTETSVSRTGTVVAGGITWQCKGNECRTKGPWATPGTGSCNALAHIVGPVTSYGHTGGRYLDEKGLMICNKGVSRASVAVAAPTIKKVPEPLKPTTTTPTKPRTQAPQVTGSNRITATAQSVCVTPGDCDADGSISIEFGGTDCDDNDGSRFPGNAEVCDADFHDEDCDFSTFGDRDTDRDGFVDQRCCNNGPDGPICGNDCNDVDASVHPIAPDACTGVDNNCDGTVDEEGFIVQWPDNDWDGFGNGKVSRVFQCPGTTGFSPLNNDCNDENAAIGPGDMACAGGGGTENILVCVGGQFEKRTCPIGTTCTPQPNGTGLCQSR
jgi:hypothetical protein